MDFVWFLIVGLLAGYLAGRFVKGSGFGLVGNLIVGVLGAILGGFIFGLLGFRTTGGLIPAIIVAFIGALALLFLIGAARKKR